MKMISRISVPVVKICILVLLVLGLLITSCKKSEPSAQSPPEESSDKQMQELGGEESTEEVSEETQQPCADKPEAKADKAVADTNASELVPLDITLPKPMFVGTPQNISVPNLEKPLGKPRGPFLAPVGTKNVAFGKLVSSTDEAPIIGEIPMVADGDREAADGSYVELGPFLQSVTIDLGADYEIYAILLWHYHKQARVYFDVIVQVSNDPDFITDVKTLFNNDHDNSAGLGIGSDMHYVETSEGKLIDAKGVQARYVRLYSNGNNSNELNHYIEVEIFGKAVK